MKWYIREKLFISFLYQNIASQAILDNEMTCVKLKDKFIHLFPKRILCLFCTYFYIWKGTDWE